MTQTRTTYEPLARTRPAHRATYGDLAVRMAADMGRTMDAEQQWILDAIYAENAPGEPASFEVGVVAPRQNLKTATLEIAAIADVFVFEVGLHIWTAHELDTCGKAFASMRDLIRSHPDYDERASFLEGHQDLSITLDTGEMIDFKARSGKGGRGYTCDKLTYDEALYLRPADTSATVPTLVTRPGAQIRYGSSAGLIGSEVLRGVRDRGRSGKDPRLAYVEYGAKRKKCAQSNCDHRPGLTEGCALDDRELRWQANPALWAGRITDAALDDQRRALASRPLEFAREFLSWWDDPPSIGGALDYAIWGQQKDLGAKRGERFAFGADVDESRLAHLAVAWVRPDGGVQVMLTREDGADRPDTNISVPAATSRLVDMANRWNAPVVLGGPSAAMETDLTTSGVTVAVTSTTDFAQACGDVHDHLMARTLWHRAQPDLDDSVLGARWRSVGSSGERAWQLKDAAGIGPLAAVTRALHGLTVPAAEPFAMWT